MFDKIRTFLVTAAAVAASAPFAAPASAAWSDFKSMGSVVITSNVSCAGLAPGSAVCVGIGQSSNVLVNLYDGTWSGWQTYASTSSSKFGVAISDPGCALSSVVNAAFNVACGVRDSLQRLEPFYISKGAKTTLSVFPPIALDLGSAPSCTRGDGASTVVCVGQSITGALVGAITHDAYASNGAWSVIPAPQLTAPVESPVSCMEAGYSSGQVICAWATIDNVMNADLYTGSAWQGNIYLGGDLSRPLNCAGIGVAGLCFGTGTDYEVYYQSYNGSGWSTSRWNSSFTSIGGEGSSYSCASLYVPAHKALNYLCGAISLVNSAFYANLFSAAHWAGWTEQFGGQSNAPIFVRNPSCFLLDPNGSSSNFMCVAAQPNGQTVSITGP